MTVIGVDDTDSRDHGMCTTYLAARLASQLNAVTRVVLVRLHPAVEHKTRGNAALAIHTETPAEPAFAQARAELDAIAKTEDPQTHPGLVVTPEAPSTVPATVTEYARTAMRAHLTLDDAREIIRANNYFAQGWKHGRGQIGALAAVGAWPALDDWTYELIAYREPDRWGTPRTVDTESVIAVADAAYPAAWDTVDREEGEAVCVPNTPGPVLYGIRGDNPAVVESVAAEIDSEPPAREQLFVTNQGTDAHLRTAASEPVRDGRAYRLTGIVIEPPDTRPGGHVFFSLETSTDSVECVAFEPTKRFRDHVRSLRVGDELTVCGEVSDGTLKLEKFAVRALQETKQVPPSCPVCGRSMESAGATQGYRCRDCNEHAESKVPEPIARDLEPGWYEVPPVARRHIAKPLIRGGFDAPIHPER